MHDESTAVTQASTAMTPISEPLAHLDEYRQNIRRMAEEWAGLAPGSVWQDSE